MMIFGKKVENVNPPIFINFHPDQTRYGNGLLIVDTKVDIKQRGDNMIIPCYPRDIDENGDIEEQQKHPETVSVHKDYLISFNLGRNRKFYIGLPTYVEDLPTELNTSLAKDFFALWVKIIQGKLIIEDIYQRDAKNKDKLLKEIASFEFYNSVLRHTGDLLSYHVKEVVGARDVPVPKYPLKQSGGENQ